MQIESIIDVKILYYLGLIIDGSTECLDSMPRSQLYGSVLLTVSPLGFGKFSI